MSEHLPDPVRAKAALIIAISPDAAAALAAARARDWENTAAAIRRIAAGYGRAGLTAAMLSWADTLAAANPATGAAGPVWKLTGEDGTIRPATLRAGDVDQVSAWCGQFAFARATADHDNVAALLAALPWDDGGQIGEYPVTLAASVGASLEAIDRGVVLRTRSPL
jgi:hypothetical protein